MASRLPWALLVVVWAGCPSAATPTESATTAPSGQATPAAPVSEKPSSQPTQVALAEDDPFAGGVDALALEEEDGSASLRARPKIERLQQGALVVRVVEVDDARHPHCVLLAKVIRLSRSPASHFKLIGRGRIYRFKPLLKLTDGQLDLADPPSRANLGVCYYPPGTLLSLRVTGVDRAAKLFRVEAVRRR